MSGAVEKIKEALHLRPHGHNRAHDVAPTAGTAGTSEEQHLHKEGESIEHKARGPAAITERLKVLMPFGKHDKHERAPEERRGESGHVLQGTVPGPAPRSGHEPIAPPSGVTRASEVPPGPISKVGFGTAAEGVAAAEDVQGGGPVSTGELASGATTTTPQRTEEHGHARGPVCDSKTIRVVEERPIEKEVVETIIEHHQIEKEYVVETRPLGEHEIVKDVKREHLGVRERIIAEGKPTIIGADVEPGPARSRGSPPATPTATGGAPAAPATPQPVHEEKQEIIRPRINS